MLQTAESGFDAAVLDRDDHLVALVEVKANPTTEWEPILTDQLARAGERVAFVFAVDLSGIQLFRSGETPLGNPIVRLDTREILGHYDSRFSEKRVFSPYLRTLVEAWIRDLAYHWRSEKPPGSEALANTGLLEAIEGGTTQPLGD